MKLSVKLFRKERKLGFKLFRNDFDNGNTKKRRIPLRQKLRHLMSNWEIFRKISVTIWQSLTLDFERELIKKIYGEQYKNSTCFWFFFSEVQNHRSSKMSTYKFRTIFCPVQRKSITNNWLKRKCSSFVSPQKCNFHLLIEQMWYVLTKKSSVQDLWWRISETTWPDPCHV